MANTGEHGLQGSMMSLILLFGCGRSKLPSFIGTRSDRFSIVMPCQPLILCLLSLLGLIHASRDASAINYVSG